MRFLSEVQCLSFLPFFLLPVSFSLRPLSLLPPSLAELMEGIRKEVKREREGLAPPEVKDGEQKGLLFILTNALL